MTGARSEARIEWLDTARGLAIGLVILYHAVGFVGAEGWDAGPWAEIVGLLGLLRIPLFFLVSGFLVSRSLDRSWRDLRRRKLANWLWPYAAWSLLTFAVFSWVPYRRPSHPADSWSDLLAIAVWPSNALWYLYALAVFVVLVRATRRWPAAVVIGSAAALALVSGLAWDDPDVFVQVSMGRYFLFFVVGARAPGLVRTLRADRRTTVGVAAACAVAGAGVLAAAHVWGLSLGRVVDVPGVRPGLSVLMVAAGALACMWASGSAVGHGLGWLGQRTLEVYVAHELLLGVAVAALPSPDRWPTWAGVVLPVALSAAALAASLGLHQLLRRVPGVYGAPRRWSTGAAPARASQDSPSMRR